MLYRQSYKVKVRGQGQGVVKPVSQCFETPSLRTGVYRSTLNKHPITSKKNTLNKKPITPKVIKLSNPKVTAILSSGLILSRITVFCFWIWLMIPGPQKNRNGVNSSWRNFDKKLRPLQDDDNTRILQFLCSIHDLNSPSIPLPSFWQILLSLFIRFIVIKSSSIKSDRARFQPRFSEFQPWRFTIQSSMFRALFSRGRKLQMWNLVTSLLDASWRSWYTMQWFVKPVSQCIDRFHKPLHRVIEA